MASNALISGLALGGGASVGLWSDTDTGVILGAFIGSIIFVMTDKDFKKLTKSLLFFASFAAGILAAQFVADMMTALTPLSVTVKRPVGALTASAIVVKMLIDLPGEITDAMKQAMKAAINKLLTRWR